MAKDVQLSRQRLAGAQDMNNVNWVSNAMKWMYENVHEKVSHKHGVIVLVRSKWASFVHGMIRDAFFVHEVIRDESGWGRCAGLILVGYRYRV